MNEIDRNRRGGRGTRKSRSKRDDDRGGRNCGWAFRSDKGRRLPTTLTSTGDTAEMNGHVFKYRSENTYPKQFVVTLEKNLTLCE